MVNINVLSHVNQCYSNNDGQKIQNLIRDGFEKNEKVTVSLKGISSLNSSFINTAFIDLLEYYDFSTIKSNLRIVNSTPQINQALKSRFNSEVELKKSENLITI